MVEIIKAGLNLMGLAVVLYLGAVAWGLYTGSDKAKSFRGLRNVGVMLVVYLVIREWGLNYANSL
ncbi:MAG: hypothetical protein AB8F74_19360 [Saprospiraceae bacterium]